MGGLDPHEQYYYRFSTKSANSSVGRFRTALPPDSRQAVKFAFFSCQDYTFGYYNAHALLANEDVDFVVNLGDYIYAEAYHSAGSKSGRRAHRPDRRGQLARRLPGQVRPLPHRPQPAPDARQVPDDLDLGRPRGDRQLRRRRTRQRRGPAARGVDPARGVPGVLREHAHLRGPPRKGTRIYRAMRFGRNVDLVLLDQRQYRADQPCDDKQVGPPCPELEQPRDFLGRKQMNFLKRRLDRTPAAWKLIASQTMAMKTLYPGGQYIGFDAWQGYPRERRELLQFIQAKNIKDVAFLTGDIHTFIAGDVRVNDNDKVPAATEFVGGSITSHRARRGRRRPRARAPTRATPRRRRRSSTCCCNQNPWVKNADPDHHGYGLVRASRSELNVKFRRVSSVKTRGARRSSPTRRTPTGSSGGRRACSKE